MQPENYYGDSIELTPTIQRALKKNGWDIVKTTNEPSILISKQENATTETRITVKRYTDLPEIIRQDAEYPYANSIDFKNELAPYRNYGPGREFTIPYIGSILKVWLLDDNICRLLNEAIHSHTCINTEAFERLMKQNTDSSRIFKLTPKPDEAVYVYFDVLATQHHPSIVPGAVVHVLYRQEMEDMQDAMQALMAAPHIPSNTNTVEGTSV